MIDYYCLCCNKPIRQDGSLLECFYINDVICAKCRSLMKTYPKKIRHKDMLVEGYYPYDGFVREQIIRYKENLDEALFPIFIYPFVEEIKKKYKDYILVPLPSSEENIEMRGFKHVEKMISLLNMTILDCLYKNENIDQKKLNLDQRSHIDEVIKLKNDVYLANRKFLLIDDIISTGESMYAAYNLLKKHSGSVKCLAFCYNQRYLSQLDRFLLTLK